MHQLSLALLAVSLSLSLSLSLARSLARSGRPADSLPASRSLLTSLVAHAAWAHTLFLSHTRVSRRLHYMRTRSIKKRTARTWLNTRARADVEHGTVADAKMVAVTRGK